MIREPARKYLVKYRVWSVDVPEYFAEDELKSDLNRICALRTFRSYLKVKEEKRIREELPGIRPGFVVDCIINTMEEIK